MKSNLNGYIEYKMFFNALAYNQQINKNLIKLFIKVNDQTYFPESIFYENYGGYSHEVGINMKRIDDIIHNIVYKL